MEHYERAQIDRGSWSYGTRRVPTTINVSLFFEFTINEIVGAGLAPPVAPPDLSGQ